MVQLYPVADLPDAQATQARERIALEAGPDSALFVQTLDLFHRWLRRDAAKTDPVGLVMATFSPDAALADAKLVEVADLILSGVQE